MLRFFGELYTGKGPVELNPLELSRHLIEYDVKNNLVEAVYANQDSVIVIVQDSISSKAMYFDHTF